MIEVDKIKKKQSTYMEFDEEMVYNVVRSITLGKEPNWRLIRGISDVDEILEYFRDRNIISISDTLDMMTARIMIDFNEINNIASGFRKARILNKKMASDNPPKTTNNVPSFLVPSEIANPLSGNDLNDMLGWMKLNMADASSYLSGLAYDRYLMTPFWRSISKIVKDMAINRCVVCDSPDKLNAHHRKYPNRGYEILNISRYLTCLCEVCHSKFHGK